MSSSAGSVVGVRPAGGAMVISPSIGLCQSSDFSGGLTYRQLFDLTSGGGHTVAGGNDESQSGLSRGIRVAIRNDATAFSYSVLITATFGVAGLDGRTPDALRLFLFVLGATGAFAVWETVASRFFQVRLRGEPSEVVVLGTAMAPLSVGVSIAAAIGVSALLSGTVVWFTAPAAATSLYVVLSGLQLEIARRAQQADPPQESK